MQVILRSYVPWLDAPGQRASPKLAFWGWRDRREGEGDMGDLSRKHCVPCEGGVPSLKPEEIEGLRPKIDSGWGVEKDHHIEREFRFKDFKQALDFTNRVGGIAEAEGHHPDIELAWGRVKVTLWTHKAMGLTENDFILAAKIDELV